MFNEKIEDEKKVKEKWRELQNNQVSKSNLDFLDSNFKHDFVVVVMESQSWFDEFFWFGQQIPPMS